MTSILKDLVTPSNEVSMMCLDMIFKIHSMALQKVTDVSMHSCYIWVVC